LGVNYQTEHQRNTAWRWVLIIRQNTGAIPPEGGYRPISPRDEYQRNSV